jgi:hypothetical protein
VSVVSLAQARKEREPHMSGAAACMVCHHSWAGVAPIGTHDLECPECHSTKGYFVAPVLRAGDRWECHCGCSVFHIARDVGPYCVNCATPAKGWF